MSDLSLHNLIPFSFAFPFSCHGATFFFFFFWDTQDKVQTFFYYAFSLLFIAFFVERRGGRVSAEEWDWTGVFCCFLMKIKKAFLTIWISLFLYSFYVIIAIDKVYWPFKTMYRNGMMSGFGVLVEFCGSLMQGVWGKLKNWTINCALASSIYSDGNFAKYIYIDTKTYKLLCVGSSGWMVRDAKQHRTKQKNIFEKSIKKENYPFFSKNRELRRRR